MKADFLPLVAVLRDLRDLGRQRRETEPGDKVVNLGRRAHAALMWVEADDAGDIEAAKRWLEQSEDSSVAPPML